MPCSSGGRNKCPTWVHGLTQVNISPQVQHNEISPGSSFQVRSVGNRSGVPSEQSSSHLRSEVFRCGQQVSAVESSKIKDAAGRSERGCSSGPGEGTERLRVDQEQASRAGSFDYVSKTSPQGSSPRRRKGEELGAAGNCSQYGDARCWKTPSLQE